MDSSWAASDKLKRRGSVSEERVVSKKIRFTGPRNNGETPHLIDLTSLGTKINGRSQTPVWISNDDIVNEFVLNSSAVEINTTLPSSASSSLKRKLSHRNGDNVVSRAKSSDKHGSQVSQRSTATAEFLNSNCKVSRQPDCTSAAPIDYSSKYVSNGQKSHTVSKPPNLQPDTGHDTPIQGHLQAQVNIIPSWQSDLHTDSSSDNANSFLPDLHSDSATDDSEPSMGDVQSHSAFDDSEPWTPEVQSNSIDSEPLMTDVQSNSANDDSEPWMADVQPDSANDNSEPWMADVQSDSANDDSEPLMADLQSSSANDDSEPWMADVQSSSANDDSEPWMADVQSDSATDERESSVTDEQSHPATDNCDFRLPDLQSRAVTSLKYNNLSSRLPPAAALGKAPSPQNLQLGNEAGLHTVLQRDTSSSLGSHTKVSLDNQLYANRGKRSSKKPFMSTSMKLPKLDEAVAFMNSGYKDVIRPRHASHSGVASSLSRTDPSTLQNVTYISPNVGVLSHSDKNSGSGNQGQVINVGASTSSGHVVESSATNDRSDVGADGLLRILLEENEALLKDAAVVAEVLEVGCLGAIYDRMKRCNTVNNRVEYVTNSLLENGIDQIETTGQVAINAANITDEIFKDLQIVLKMLPETQVDPYQVYELLIANYSRVDRTTFVRTLVDKTRDKSIVIDSPIKASRVHSDKSDHDKINEELTIILKQYPKASRVEVHGLLQNDKGDQNRMQQVSDIIRARYNQTSAAQPMTSGVGVDMMKTTFVNRPGLLQPQALVNQNDVIVDYINAIPGPSAHSSANNYVRTDNYVDITSDPTVVPVPGNPNYVIKSNLVNPPAGPSATHSTGKPNDVVQAKPVNTSAGPAGFPATTHTNDVIGTKYANTTHGNNSSNTSGIPADVANPLHSDRAVGNKTSGASNNPAVDDPIMKDTLYIANIFPNRSQHEIYAYLEAHYNNVYRRQVVIEEFLNMADLPQSNTATVTSSPDTATASNVQPDGIVGSSPAATADNIIDPQEQLENDGNLLEGIFPDCDPLYITRSLEGLADKPDRVQILTDAWFENKDYPKLKDRLEMENKGSQKLKLQNQTLDDIPGFLAAFPDVLTTFYDESKPVSRLYKEHLLPQLKNSFPRIQVPYIRQKIEEHAYHLAPIWKALSEEESDDSAPSPDLVTRTGYFPKRKLPKYLKNKRRPTNIMPNNPDEVFYRELLFVRNEQTIKDYITNQELEKTKRRTEAKENDLLQECTCCFDDEVLPEDMLPCPEGHLFCKECIRRSTETVIGDAKTTFRCLTGHCESEFAVAILQEALPAKMFSKVLVKIQEEEIRQAEVEDLVSCPFCSFATIMPNEEDKLFKCLNPECLKESCRLCGQLNHIPLRCEEIEKPGETSMRAYIENQMTEAMLRTCWKCKKRFFKTEGCNKMTCTCGASMCYICRQPITDYSHFNNGECRQSGNNIERLHLDEMKKAAEEARLKYELEHPEQQGQQLKNEPLKLLEPETSTNGRSTRHQAGMQPVFPGIDPFDYGLVNYNLQRQLANPPHAPAHMPGQYRPI